MSIDQQLTAISKAPRHQLDNLSRALWTAHGAGEIDDAGAQALSEAIHARRTAPAPARPRRSVGSRPRARESLERRRQCVASGVLPAKLAAPYTPGEAAALSVIGRAIGNSGRCELSIDAIAAMAGVGRTTVQNAVRQASSVGLVKMTERPRPGMKSLTNVIEALDPLWRAWLTRFGGNYRVQNPEPHVVRRDSRGQAIPGIQGCAPRKGGIGQGREIRIKKMLENI